MKGGLGRQTDGPSDEALTACGPGLRLRRDVQPQPPFDSRRCPQQKDPRLS